MPSSVGQPSLSSLQDKAPIISSSSPPVAVSPSPSPSPLPQPDALESITVEEIRNLSEVVTTLKGDRLLEDEIQELKDEREEHREVSRAVIRCSKCTVPKKHVHVKILQFCCDNFLILRFYFCNRALTRKLNSAHS